MDEVAAGCLEPRNSIACGTRTPHAILTGMTATKSNLRWIRPSPDSLVLALLAVLGILFVSERFQWFAFNEKKGWTVLIAVATVAAFLLLMLLWLAVALVFRRASSSAFARSWS